MELEPHETALFNMLRAVVAESGCGSTLRVAGGWVRDKLLGSSDSGGDLDLVVDNMSAIDFAALLAQHRPAETKGGKVIASRPEQHKHVEVVALKLLDSPLAIELASHLGRTPEAEARRRDFTINSLLYNINCGTVEDHTGLGLADLRAGLLRTPLDPLETLGHDPLRLLRCVRFAARFGFRVDPELAAALRDAKLHQALRDSVARQRCTIEITKMLTGPRPDAALLDLCQNGLHRVVFTPSKKGSEFWTDELTRLACLAIQSVNTMPGSNAEDQGDVPTTTTTTPMEGASLLAFHLSTLFLPLCFSPLCLTDRGRPTHLPFTKWDMREHWMFPDQVGTAVFLLIARAHDFEAFAGELDRTGAVDRLPLALALRDLGPGWAHALQLAHVLSVLRLARAEEPSSRSHGSDDREKLAARFRGLRAWIIERSGLVGGPQGAVWAVAPLVSAKTLLETLRRQTQPEQLPTGKDIGRLLALALDWQLARHHTDDGASTSLVDECVAWAVARWRAES